ncbi:MAG: hypothetical protein LBI14_12050 [Treponema sp.]|jgi:hypothetical protein|nr:hypothetical protein [Treponema sp.]
MSKKGKKLPFILRFFRALLIFLVLIVIVWIGFSLIGRINAARVMPSSFSVYVRAPNPVHLVRALLGHESLPEILALREMADVAPVIRQIADSGLLENKWIQLAGQGNLEAAILTEGHILAAWDLGFLSPALRVLPLVAGFISVPNLYYVQGGKYSRFEYRMEDGSTFFIGPYRNLMIISNSSSLFESVLDGTQTNNGKAVEFLSKDYDVACLLSEEFILALAAPGGQTGGQDPLASALGLLQFNGPIEAAIKIRPRQLDLSLVAALSSTQRDIEKIISRPSVAPDLFRMIPDNTQYLTLISAGSLEDILNAASAIPGSEIREPWRVADSAARTLLRVSIDDILLSWTGEEFAVFGMEGREAPVILLEIRDERRRQEIFDRLFRSLFVNENINLNLDGTRLPRIELPNFLSSLLLSMGIHIPSPYYTVHDGYLFISESAESLLAAVNGARRTRGLLRTEVWQTLGQVGPDKSSFTLFYSLDRTMPFFLRGNNAIAPILRLYRQGLARLSFEDNRVHVGLSIIPGQGSGLTPAPGFPIALSGRPVNQAYILKQGNESRILLSRGNSALSINPADQSVKTLDVPGTSTRVWVIPADGIDGAIWVVSSQGRVYLTDKDLEEFRGFPRITGLRISAAPVAWNKKLYLFDYDGAIASIHALDETGNLEKWPQLFYASILAPVSFINFQNRTYTACYPKEFFGSIYLMDGTGAIMPGWPQSVFGIAFGSPLLFAHNNSLMAAFVTQAGELTVFDEEGNILPSFPLDLDGVFYLQPVFDNEFLWLIAADGMLFQVSLEGTVLSQRIQNLQVREEGYITVVDVDKDGRKEIFISGEGNALYGYTGSFMSLESFPLPIWGKPGFGIANNSKTEIAGVGMDNRVYLWQFK